MITEKILAQANKVDPDLVNLPGVKGNSDSLQKFMAVVFGVAAAMAVLIIIIAAVEFALGGGNPEKVSRAKNTIIYALVGLIIAVSAEAIVYTVLGKL